MTSCTPQNDSSPSRPQSDNRPTTAPPEKRRQILVPNSSNHSPFPEILAPVLRVLSPIALSSAIRLRVLDDLHKVRYRVESVVSIYLGADEVAGMGKRGDDGPFGGTVLWPGGDGFACVARGQPQLSSPYS